MSTQMTHNRNALLPADERLRELARDLYEDVADAPIISPHGHVDPALLLRDEPFPDPAELLLTRDHYITRLLFASGASFADFGRDPQQASAPARGLARARLELAPLRRHRERILARVRARDAVPRARTNCRRRTPMRYTTASWPCSTSREFRPRALFTQFGIEVLATTDDPLDDLEVHRLLAGEPGAHRSRAADLPPRRLPRPRRCGLLGSRADSARDHRTGRDIRRLPRALEDRRAHFVSRGAVSADHGVYEPFTAELSSADAERLFRGAREGVLDPDAQRLFRGHMLFQMARMSVDDGLVMTVHPGVRRNHHTALFDRFGPDAGHDIPVRVEYTENLRPLLNAFGTAPGFHLVLFAIDETVYSREVAPLAGFYPSVYIGAPWWFLDAPDAALRFRSAVTETAGFYRSSGFIDDTRAFLSIPARHDMSRRMDASFLARLVAEERVSMPTARRIARDLVDAIPREVFKL